MITINFKEQKFEEFIKNSHLDNHMKEIILDAFFNHDDATLYELLFSNDDTNKRLLSQGLSYVVIIV